MPITPQSAHFNDVETEAGTSLLQLSVESPVLLIFLRHWGCPFCRQMLRDFSLQEAAVRQEGAQPVFVHMGTPERARPYFAHYQLATVERISDPEQRLYRHPAFGLSRKAIFRHLFDPAAVRSFLGGITLRHGIELLAREEDRTQMPGIFLLHQGQVVRRYHPRSIAEKPDFVRVARLPRVAAAR